MQLRSALCIALVSLFFTLGCTEPDGAVDAATVPDALASDSGGSNPVDAPPGDDLDASSDALAMAPCGASPPLAVVDVSVADLHQLITAAEALAVVDVREPEETASGIIAGALTYPWTSGVLTADHAALPDDVPLFVICRSGSRSALASQFLFDNGHACVHNVLGGMNAWTGAGYPTVSP